MAGFSPLGIGLIAVPVLLSLTLHEFGHARMALAFGDDTAKREGRVSLNPLVHLDVLGTLCFLFGPVGWAKPVPVVSGNLRPPRIGDLAVSLAGVGMNLVLILLAAAGLILMSALGVQVNSDADSQATPAGVAAFMLTFTLIINFALVVFNLIPLYPLDGHHVLRELLPARMRAGFMDWQRNYGRYALLAVLVVPWLAGVAGVRVFNPIGMLMGKILWPAIDLLLPDDGFLLALEAWVRYVGYLPYAS